MPEKNRVQCTSCFATLAVPDSAAGKKIRCPKCQGKLSVPQGKPSPRDTAALSHSNWQTADSYGDPSTDESEEADWNIHDEAEPDTSMDEAGKADWNTDKFSQAPPALPSRNRNIGKPAKNASIPKKKDDRRELRNISFPTESSSHPGTGNSRQGSEEPLATVEGSPSNSLVPKICIAVVGVAVLVGICLVFGTKTAQVKRRTADLWVEAQKRLEEKKVEEAAQLLTEYTAAWQATEIQKARNLLQQIRHVTLDSEVQKSLVELSETGFALAKSTLVIQDGLVTHPVLLEARAASIQRNLTAATRLRSEAFLREQQEQAEAAAREEEEQRQELTARQEAQEAVEKARREEEARASTAVGQSAGATRLLGLNTQEREQVRKEVAGIEASLASADSASRTVYQQQAARIDACIETTGLLARTLGATPDEVATITEKLSTADLASDTVFQQVVGHLTVYVNVLELASVKAGASQEACANVQSTLKTQNVSARTVQHQIVHSIAAAASMSHLLAGALGVTPKDLLAIGAQVDIDEIRADTVFQQMVARQTGLVRVLGAAALAEGGAAQPVASLDADFSRDDLKADGVQQQLALRLQTGFQMTVLLVNAIVAK